METIIANFLDGDGYNFQLTPGGFLAMQHLMLHHYLTEVRQSGKNHFLSSVVEEVPVLKALDQMEMMGCGVKLLPVDSSGRIDLKALEESIRAKTSLISISAACHMTGVMQPIQEILQLCHSKGVKVHVHATHAIGTWGVSLKEWNVDYLTFDRENVGALLSREKIQEGWVNPSALMALAENLKHAIAKQEMFAMESARLRSEFEQELNRAIPDCKIFGQDVARVPHIFTVCFPGLHNEALHYYLSRQNIGSNAQNLTSILKQCGVADEFATGAVSFILSEEDDHAAILNGIVTSVRKLKKMSVAL